MDRAMLTAKPIRAFVLAGRRILTCRVVGQNPHAFIGKDLYFYADSREPKRIHIEGLSTASDIQGNEYDFLYTGDEVLPSEISEEAIVAEGSCEETMAK
ncbi:MAG: hypothetical protein WHU94_00530 [Thermogemmata sp.]|uniref:Uncharacterized protein n=1 Tax=Thermogemmata fonticola TaxID=2755323 RepID=A0A7V9ACZ6_9BACT|nr:hypothetical protein [Thermogemmata fonticola]MBA2227287.1 hypothetical protein [Thermogemmata fonticola]